MAYTTREEWLQAFVAAARPVFERAGTPLPEKVRASIGFTSKGRRSSRIGECWSDACSSDGTFEIFIVPGTENASRVADILTHELVHVAVGLAAGHGPAFGKLARALGLEGPLTATVAGDGWRAWAEPILSALGDFPHAALLPTTSGPERKTSAPKTQKNRMVKCECTDCGFVFRAARSWLDCELKCPDTACGGSVVVKGN